MKRHPSAAAATRTAAFLVAAVATAGVAAASGTPALPPDLPAQVPAWPLLLVAVAAIIVMLVRRPSPGRARALVAESAQREADRRLLAVIASAQSAYIRSSNLRNSFDPLLAQILELTDSRFGFVGEVLYDDAGKPYLRSYVISNIAWDEASAAFYREHAPQGMIFGNLETLFGRVLTSAQPLISNNPRNDPRSGGIPPGHPELESFLGLPILYGDAMIGMIGMANRPGGYAPSMITYLEPLLRSLGQLIHDLRQESERQRIQQQLEQEREDMLARVDRLFEHLPGVVYQYEVRADGSARFPFTSAGPTRIFDVARDVSARTAQPVLDMIPADERARVVEGMAAAARTGTIWSDQFRAIHPQRGEIWVSCRASPESRPNGDVLWHGFALDITATRQTEVALERERARFRATVDNLPGAVYRCRSDAQWTMAYLSDEIRKITGHPAHDFIDNRERSFASVVHPDDLAATFRSVATTPPGESYELTYRIRHADGREVWVRDRGRCEYDDAGQPVWCDGFLWDVTDYQRVERMKSQFVSTVSHELRTPLTAVVGALGLIGGGALGEPPPAMRRMLDLARQNSESLQALIDDLLDVEKLGEGKLVLQPEVVAVQPLVDQAIDEIQAYAARFHVTVVAGRRDAATFLVDGRRFRQILGNYLSNACKFSPAGSTVVVEARQEKGRVVVTVTDCGEGIPEEFQPYLFEKFSQGEAPNTRRRGGTGLGLAISRELARQMGGEVGFRSTPGKGSSFWVSFPTAAQQDQPGRES